MSPQVRDMAQESQQFYERWAAEQLRDPNRAAVLKWKAQTLVDLCRRAGLELCGHVLEIGCAEGALLDGLLKAFPEADYSGLDISENFIEVGKKLFPGIELRCQESDDFFREKPHVDFVVLSDLIEHVEDADAFLRGVVPHCDYVLVKIPLEVCAYDHSPLIRAFRKMAGRTRFPPAYGPGHPDGHLRGFTVRSARALLERNRLTVLAEKVDTVHQFYDRARMLDFIAALSKGLCVYLFGGTYFGVARTPTR